MPKTILITGASGNIGTKLSAHLAEDYLVRRLDLKGGRDTLAADLAVYDERWVSHFDGADAVVHLAGEMRPVAAWESCYRGNVVTTANVLRAARAAGVKRVVYASSNQVMAGYRFLDGPVTEAMAPKPLNPYGVSKLVCEQLCEAFAAESGLSVIAFRIGYIDPGENRPGPHMAIGLWGQQMWLSNGDAMRAFRCALEAEGVSYALLNLVSRNLGMRWDLSAAHEVIGYVPADAHVPQLLPVNEAEDAAARQARLVPGHWLDQRFAPLDVD